MYEVTCFYNNTYRYFRPTNLAKFDMSKIPHGTYKVTIRKCKTCYIPTYVFVGQEYTVSEFMSTKFNSYSSDTMKSILLRCDVCSSDKKCRYHLGIIRSISGKWSLKDEGDIVILHLGKLSKIFEEIYEKWESEVRSMYFDK